MPTELPSILDLDTDITVPVKIAGREFKLTQQSWPNLKRIVHYINVDGEAEVPVADGEAPVEKTAEDIMAKNYENAIPIISLMFGYDKDDKEKQDVIDFLSANLTPSKALKIFQAWWQLNEVDDFFDRGGRILRHPDIVKAMQEYKMKALTEEISS